MIHAHLNGTKKTHALSRREAIKMIMTGFGSMMGVSLLSACDRDGLVLDCELIDDHSHAWGPSVLRPVSYGYADYDSSTGAPSKVRVFYPSLGFTPECAPFLASRGHFSLVIFLHGQCSEESAHYTRWFHLPAMLARSGFIVAVPDLTGISFPWELSNAIYDRIRQVIVWIKERWSHKDFLVPHVLGIVGHSFGALHGAQLALEMPETCAYVSLDGGWTEWPTIPASPLRSNSLTVPKLLIWGTGDVYSTLDPGYWDAVALPKHRLVFEDAEHWDFLSVSETTTPCSGGGDCDLVPSLTADVTAVFLSSYMASEQSGILRRYINDNLILPVVDLRPEQERYVAHFRHLKSFADIERSSVCRATLTWKTPDGSDMRSMPAT